MDYKLSLNTSFKSSWIIIKLVIPIYILADILFYYNTLSYISFLIEPFTSMLSLPKEASLAIISGMFLNLYAAIAFAAPLDMTPMQWTILAIYLGICHSLIVEGVIMKKLGISNLYSYSLRTIAGFLVAFIVSLFPLEMFPDKNISTEFVKDSYSGFFDLIVSSFYNASILTVKIIILIVALIFIMDYIKNINLIKQSSKNISKGFSIGVGIILGITYGAGILIKEYENGSLSKDDIFFIGTFLMICHAIIEDTLLFVIFGADFTMVVVVRTIAAIVLSYILLFGYKRIQSDK